MKLKFNKIKVPVASWTIIGHSLTKQMILHMVKVKGGKFIFTTKLSLDKNELYAFIFFHNKIKRLIDSILVGKVIELGNGIDNNGGIAYEFNVENELDFSKIFCSESDDEPLFVMPKSKKLTRRKRKLKNKT